MSSRPTTATRVAAGPFGAAKVSGHPFEARRGSSVPTLGHGFAPPLPSRPRIDKAVLASAIYHELRSALGLISGYSESLLHLDLDETTRRRYLEGLASAAASLSEIADQLLGLAAADPRRPIVRRQPVALAWLAARLAADAAAEVPGAVVEVDIAEGLPLVEADPIWLGLVLRNLVRNALTHGCGGRPEARIRAERRGDQIVVAVSDEGPGFDPAERDLAFGLFFRGRRAQSSGRQGLGLGLYLCRALIEAHGGSIWIEEGRPGATVAFSLPIGTPGRTLVAMAPRAWSPAGRGARAVTRAAGSEGGGGQ